MPKYLGDFAVNTTIVEDFNTTDGTGAPITLAGTPAVLCYKNSTTESAATGITLTVDYDSRTGMHHLVIDQSANSAFFATGNDFRAVLTAGTVGGTSVVGTVLFSWSVENRSAIRPTVAGRTLDVSSGGEAGLDWANIGSPTTTVALSGTTVADTSGTATLLTRVPNILPTFVHTAGKLWVLDENGNSIPTTTTTDVLAAAASTPIAADVKKWAGQGNLAVPVHGDIDGFFYIAAECYAYDVGASQLKPIDTLESTASGGSKMAVVAYVDQHGLEEPLADMDPIDVNVTEWLAHAVTVDGSNNPVVSLAADGLDATGYVAAIWGALTSTLTTPFTIGKWILDKLDVAVSTRAAVADVNITVTPIAATITAGTVSSQDLDAYQFRGYGYAIATGYDYAGNLYNLSGKVCKFTVSDYNNTALYSLMGTVTGADNNTVIVTSNDTKTQTAGEFKWSLDNTTDDVHLMDGTLTVKRLADSI